jgi:hypothetical protein
MRGSASVYSIYSWGCAIDLNAKNNPLASTGKWSTAFINTIKTGGIFREQNWIGRKDPIHFDLVKW